jgi:hypothetical protein
MGHSRVVSSHDFKGNVCEERNVCEQDVKGESSCLK